MDKAVLPCETPLSVGVGNAKLGGLFTKNVDFTKQIDGFFQDPFIRRGLLENMHATVLFIRREGVLFEPACPMIIKSSRVY